ncbi:MAG: AAA family ATPase, partial [Hyphomicrobiales bacterium]|nr:AAA family ATPase [Hyphomicrobiales bacterium]
LAEGAIGSVPNLAGRIMNVAKPGTFFIGPVTHRQIGELFECADLGPHRLKGFRQNVHLWQVLREKPAKSRFAAMHARDKPAPLVGRAGELAKLSERFEIARKGRGEIVAICGDAGTGKSRLLEHAFLKDASRDASAIRRKSSPGEAAEFDPLILQCSPFSSSVAFFPLRVYFDYVAQLGTGDAPHVTARKLHQFMLGLWSVTAEQFVLICDFLELPPALDLAQLLNIPEHAIADIRGLNSLEKRNRLFRVFLVFLEAMANRSPLIIVEDIHWIDPSTTYLLESFLKILRRLPVLLVTTSRNSQIPIWLETPYSRQIKLDRLYPEEINSLVSAIAHPHVLPDAVLQAIIERSDGIPIFAEELTRGYLEQGERLEQVVRPDAASSALDLHLVPSTLTESLLARLDGLKYGRQIAPIAAVLARIFPVDLLLEIAPMPKADALAGIRELLDAGVLVPGHNRYGEALAFRHMLVRDAAYQMILRHDRKRLHARVAEILEEKFGEVSAKIPHLLAYQLKGAGQLLRAAVKWGEAGLRASCNSNSEEAISYYRSAIAANAELPPSPARDQREMSYRIAIVEPLLLTQGFGSPVVDAEIDAAVTLARRTGVKSQIIRALVTQWGSFTRDRGQRLKDTLALARQISNLASGSNEFDRLIAHSVLGASLMLSGDFGAAKPELLKFFEIYRPQLHNSELEIVGPSNRLINSAFWLAECYAIQNDLTKARYWQSQCIRAARDSGQTNALITALCFGGCLIASLTGDLAQLNQYASELRSAILLNDQPLWRGQVDLFTGLTLIRQGRPNEGFAIAMPAIEEIRGVRFFIMNSQVELADACITHGRLYDCAEILADTSLGIQDGWANMAAEFHRVEGRLAQVRGERELARKSYRLAMSTAKAQGATLFYIRARQALDTLNASPSPRPTTRRRPVRNQALAAATAARSPSR